MVFCLIFMSLFFCLPVAWGCEAVDRCGSSLAIKTQAGSDCPICFVSQPFG